VRPADLIATAKKLISPKVGKPKQSDLRRALSSAYYAMFHTLAKCCADLLVGGPGSKRSKPAWKQVYRSLEHRFAKDACNKKELMAQFPKGIQIFAAHFVDMQVKRHAADYDPDEKFYKSAVSLDIDMTEIIIELFRRESLMDRRAFAALVLFRNRP